MPSEPSTNSHKPKTILLVGGGTGGHIFPLYNLAAELVEQGAEVHLVVNDAELDRKILDQTFAKLPITPHFLKAHKLHYHFALSNLVNWVKIIGSFWSARRLVKKVQPDTIFFKGGFVGFPILIAAKWLPGFKGKIYLHDSDIAPGALSKLFAKHADQTFSNFGENAHPLFYWPNKTAAPTCHPEQSEGPLADQRKTIFIFGGSQGAQFINDLIIDNAEVLCKKYHVVLVAGPGKSPSSELLSPNLQIHEFMAQEELIKELSRSTLVIARAGASMFQVLAAQKPMIAIPLPTAARNHQQMNAQYFTDKGLCYLLEQNKDTQGKFLPMVEHIVQDKDLLKGLRKYDIRPAANAIAKVIINA